MIGLGSDKKIALSQLVEDMACNVCLVVVEINAGVVQDVPGHQAEGEELLVKRLLLGSSHHRPDVGEYIRFEIFPDV